MVSQGAGHRWHAPVGEEVLALRGRKSNGRLARHGADMLINYKMWEGRPNARMAWDWRRWLRRRAGGINTSIPEPPGPAWLPHRVFWTGAAALLKAD